MSADEPQPRPTHCGCQFRHWWCAERLARWKAREQSRDRLRGQLVLDFWTRPLLGGPADVLRYWPPATHQGTAPRPWDGGVKRLHEPRARNRAGQLHRRVRAPRPR